MRSLFLAAVLTLVPAQSHSQIAPECEPGLSYPLSFKARISSPFGMRRDPFGRGRRMHHGIDLVAPSGTPVLSAMRGQAIIAGTYGGYGLTVVLESPSHQERTLYAHLSRVLIGRGAIVNPQTTIGRVGSTGMSTGPHLHFEQQEKVGDRWVAINPTFDTADCGED